MTTTTHRRTTANRWRIAAIAAATAATLAFVGMVGASADTIKTEQFSFMADSTTQSHPTFSAIATGAFTAGGTATVNHGTVTIQLPKGTLTLQVRADHVTTHTTPDCLQEKVTSGHYTIASGTGAYRGITGSGTTRVNARFVESKTADTCSETFDAAQVLVTASGPTTLP